MDITATIKVIGEIEQVSEKFKKREVVLTDNSSQYPQHISFQLAQDKVSLIDKHNVGDTIKAHFNLRGREWTSPKNEVRYFNTLEIWRIEGMANGDGDSLAKENTPVAETSQIADGEYDDQLPF